VQNKAIVIQIGKKYGLTEQEAVQMYEQYWMEFVIRKLASLKFDYLSIMGLGAYVAIPKVIKVRHDTFDKKVRLRSLYLAAYQSRFKTKPEQELS
jgi:hypothetical protein